MAKKKEPAVTKETAIEEMCDQVVNDLKELRESKNITTAKLSEMTGIAQPNITRMETGKTLPTLKTVATIAHALEVKIGFVEKEQ
jgi:transcriptional regulator with XRE-family HTH domain